MGNSHPSEGKAIVKAHPAESYDESAESSYSKQLKLQNETRRSVGKNINRMAMQVGSLQKRFYKLKEDELKLEKMGHEAMDSYGTNAQAIMLFHGLGSMFLQIKYPHAGLGVMVLMVLSFFSAFMVASIVTFSKFDTITQRTKNLQSQQRELQNDVTNVCAKIERPCSDLEHKTLAESGELRGVLESVDILKKEASTLEKSIARIELSDSESNRMRSLFQLAIVAIVYGLCFPQLAYFILYLVGFRNVGTMVAI